jgi:hypothetical protein
MFQGEINRLYCPFYASLGNQTAVLNLERGFHLSQLWHYYIEGQI